MTTTEQAAAEIAPPETMTSPEANGAPTDAAADALDRKKHKYTRIEIWKPPTDGLHGYFGVEIHDPYGVEPVVIVKEETPWVIWFSVWLYGDIWKCVSGTLCTDVFFERANDGQRFKLSDLVGPDKLRQEFEGCRHFHKGAIHKYWKIEIPAGKLPSGPHKPAYYDWRAVLSFEDPCGNPGVLSGYEKGHVQVWDSHPDEKP